MKAAREEMSEKKILSLGLMLLAAFALISVAALEFYPASVQAQGFRGMKRSPEQIVSRLKERLNLTDDQVKALDPIIRESMAKRLELIKQLRNLRQSTDDKINAVLTKEQAIEYQKIKDRQRARMRSGRSQMR